jgi:hypothetical protein
MPHSSRDLSSTRSKMPTGFHQTSESIDGSSSTSVMRWNINLQPGHTMQCMTSRYSYFNERRQCRHLRPPPYSGPRLRNYTRLEPDLHHAHPACRFSRNSNDSIVESAI